MFVSGVTLSLQNRKLLELLVASASLLVASALLVTKGITTSQASKNVQPRGLALLTTSLLS